jgi:hypothetical protein
LLLVVDVVDIGGAGLGAHALRLMAAAASVIMTRILMYLKFPLLSLAGCWRLLYAVGFDRTTQIPPQVFRWDTGIRLLTDV